MYTEQDKARMQAWEQIIDALADVHKLYDENLGNDSQASKPMFESTLYAMREIARAQAKLWRNPNTCKCGHSNVCSDHA